MPAIPEVIKSVALALVCSCAALSDDAPPLVIEAPAEMGPAEQARITVRLLSPFNEDLEGRIVLETSGDDRAALFSTGGRVAEFRIAANSTEATFDGRNLYMQSGAGAGQITLRANFARNGDASGNVEAAVQVSRIAPIIDIGGVRVRAVDGQAITLDTRQFEVIVPGVAPDRDIARAEFRFQPSRAGSLARTDIPVDLSAPFRNHFAANPGRNDFILVMPFTVEGSLLDIACASVTLVNSAGERSNEASADSEILP